MWHLGGALLVLTLSGPAAAERRTAQLAVERGAGAETCPTEPELRISIARRLGYNPFDAGSARVVTCTLTRSGETLRAHIRISEAGGTFAAERQIVSRRADCGELAAALELSLAVAIDPLRPLTTAAASEPAASADSAALQPQAAVPAVTTPRGPVTPGPGGESEADDATEVREPRPPNRDPETEITGTSDMAARDTVPTEPPITDMMVAAAGLAIGFGAVPSDGLMPNVSPGATLQLGWETPRWSVAMEARGDPAGSVESGAGRVTASRLGGSILPCERWGSVGLCAVATVAALFARLDRPEARRAILPVASAGMRVQTDFPLAEAISLRIQMEAHATFVGTWLVVHGEKVWNSPPFSLTAGLGVAWRMP